MNPHFSDIYIPVLCLVLLSVPVTKYSGSLQTQAASLFFHSRAGASGQSCPVTRDTGPSQRPDTALDMAGPAGHGKTARLPSTQQPALYKNTRIGCEEPIAVNRLLCPLHKGLIQRGYSLNKAFDSVEDPWLCCSGGTQAYRLRGEYRSVCAAHSSRSKYIRLIQAYKAEGLVLPHIWLQSDGPSVFIRTDYWMHTQEKTIEIPH